MSVVREASGNLDNHVAINIDDLADGLFDGRCTVPSAEFVMLIGHLLTLPSRSIIHQQRLLTVKARLLETMNEVDAALEALQASYELQSENAMPLYFSAHTLSVAGRLDEAVQYLTRAYEVEKTSLIQHKGIARTVYTNIGSMYVAKNRIEQALAIYAEGVLSIPDEPRFYLQKAKLLIQLGRVDDAQRTLISIRSLNSNTTREHEFLIRRLERALQESRAAPAPVSL